MTAWESWDRFADNCEKCATGECQFLAVTWAPHLGYEFIDLRDWHAPRRGNSGNLVPSDALLHLGPPAGEEQANLGWMIEEFKTLAAGTRDLLPQDGIRENWVVLLDAVRKSDSVSMRVVRQTTIFSIYATPEDIPKPYRPANVNFLPGVLAEIESRRKFGAVPEEIEFVHPCTPYDPAKALAGDFSPADKQRITYEVEIATVQMGTLKPKRDQFYRVLARVGLQQRNTFPRRDAAPVPSPSESPPPPLPPGGDSPIGATPPPEAQGAPATLSGDSPRVRKPRGIRVNGEFLKRLRTEYGSSLGRRCSQVEFADMLEVAHATYRKAENGDRIDEGVVEQIVERLNESWRQGDNPSSMLSAVTREQLTLPE
jgi:hypothetical protein